MGWRILGTIAALVGLALAGCGAGQFTCQSDAQCMGESPGVCQPDGHCSFPAADCPSGQRYGEHSGPQSGQCVGEAGETGSTGAVSTTSPVTTAPMSEDSGPVLDSGEPTTTGREPTTDPPATDSGVVTTGDEASTTEATTGEPVDPDLVLWLALDRAPLGDVLDSSSYMGNGACEGTGCPASGPGVVGAGASYDGQDDVIVVPHAAWLETTDGFTVATFIRIGDVPLDFRSIVAKPVGAANENTWEMFFQDQLITFGMSSGGSYYAVEVPWQAAPDQWTHLAGTWDGGLVTLWIDGEAVGTADSPAFEFDEQPILVGADDDHVVTGLEGFFLGGIDDVRVYRRALAADEIAVLAAG